MADIYTRACQTALLPHNKVTNDRISAIAQLNLMVRTRGIKINRKVYTNYKRM